MDRVVELIERLSYWVFWRRPGTSLKIKWPLGESADPNTLYRPWLEQHIGRQLVDWNWRVNEEDMSVIELKFVGKAHRNKAFAAKLSLKASSAGAEDDQRVAG